jgi:hypothetical protein
MSTTTTYEPLYAVPPVTEQRAHMALLLRMRDLARAAYDAAVSAPRKAASYVKRLVQSASMSRAGQWLRRVLTPIVRPLAAVAARSSRTWIGAAVAVVSSPTGRAVLDAAAGLLGKGMRWVASQSYDLVDRGLRLFGKPGNKAADKLFSATVSLGGRLASVAAPVVHRVARLSDPTAPHVRVIGALSRSYVLHRLCKGLFGNSVLQVVMEAALIPAVLDSRLTVWLRTVLRQIRTRAEALKAQEAVVAELPTVPEVVDDQAAEQLLDESLMHDEVLETPVPMNRAERRAAERQQRRHVQH